MLLKKGGERMANEIILALNEISKWGIKKEPFATIECSTEDDYNTLVGAKEKQVPRKIKYLNMQAACPDCLDKIFRNYRYCPGCGQKLNWD